MIVEATLMGVIVLLVIYISMCSNDCTPNKEQEKVIEVKNMYIEYLERRINILRNSHSDDIDERIRNLRARVENIRIDKPSLNRLKITYKNKITQTFIDVIGYKIIHNFDGSTIIELSKTNGETINTRVNYEEITMIEHVTSQE